MEEGPKGGRHWEGKGRWREKVAPCIQCLSISWVDVSGLDLGMVMSADPTCVQQPPYSYRGGGGGLAMMCVHACSISPPGSKWIPTSGLGGCVDSNRSLWAAASNTGKTQGWRIRALCIQLQLGCFWAKRYSFGTRDFCLSTDASST